MQMTSNVLKCHIDLKALTSHGNEKTSLTQSMYHKDEQSNN